MSKAVTTHTSGRIFRGVSDKERQEDKMSKSTTTHNSERIKGDEHYKTKRKRIYSNKN